MPLSEKRRQECLRIISKLLQHRIATLFAQPVDPKLDNCLDYFDVIQNPMDLGTIKRKLQTNVYNRYSEFHSDVELIWKNAFKFNGPDSLISLIAEQLRSWFEAMTKNMSDDENFDWIDVAQSLQEDIDKYFGKVTEAERNASNSHSNKKTTAGKCPQGMMNMGRGKGNYFVLKDFSSYTIPSPPPSPPSTYTPSPSQQTFIQSPITTKKPSRPRPTKKSFTYDEIKEMREHIAALDVPGLKNVLTIIQRHEPDLKIFEDSVIDMYCLKIETQNALYSYLANTSFV